MNENLKSSTEAVSDLFGWVCHWQENGDLELENWSPAGENLVEYAPAPDVIKNFVENARAFDVDEHIEMWIGARGSTSGVPSTRVLCQDAEEIDEMLNDLADALETLGNAFSDGADAIYQQYDFDATGRDDAKLLIRRDGETIVGTRYKNGAFEEQMFIDASLCIEWLYEK